MLKKRETLTFLFSQKDDLTVVTLIGKIIPDTLEQLAQLQIQTSDYQSKGLILYCRDLDEIHPELFESFKRMVEKLSKQFCREFKICSLRPMLRRELIEAEVVPNDLFTNNLKESVVAMLNELQD